MYDPEILNYVEDILGPDFVLWGGQFFLKEPNDGSIVPWHQDIQYWPLKPAKAVTVWLALYDTNEENGAMKIVKAVITMDYLNIILIQIINSYLIKKSLKIRLTKMMLFH